jgi:hypothetical protein
MSEILSGSTFWSLAPRTDVDPVDCGSGCAETNRNLQEHIKAVSLAKGKTKKVAMCASHVSQ